MERGGRGGKQLCKFVMCSRQGLQRKKTAEQKESVSGDGEKELEGNDWGKVSKGRTGELRPGEQRANRWWMSKCSENCPPFPPGGWRVIGRPQSRADTFDSCSEKISLAARME